MFLVCMSIYLLYIILYMVDIAGILGIPAIFFLHKILHGVCQRYRTGPAREREDKELTHSLCDPLGLSKRLSFWPANRRGSPSRIEGLGSSIKGVKGKGSPCRFGQSPRSLFTMPRHGSAEADIASQSLFIVYMKRSEMS